MKAAAPSKAIPGIQDEFPSLDFPGRTVLYAHEVAERLGCSKQHIYDLIDEGLLAYICLTGAGNRTERQSIRVPVDGYHAFLERQTHNRPSQLTQARLRLN